MKRRRQWICLACLLVLYLLSGMVIFHFVERPYEDQVSEEFKDYLDSWYEQKECLRHDSVRELAKIFTHTYRNGGRHASNSGIFANNNTLKSSWGSPEALFFSFSAISTIGYGHIVPKTAGGRLFCIVYSFFGIPFVIALAANVGYNINTFRQKLVSLLTKLFKLKNRTKIKLCKCIVCCALVTAGIVLPSIGLGYLYDLTVFEMLYFTFITMSTIGFGDIIPELHYRKTGSRFLLYVVNISWCILLLGLFTLLLGLCETTENNVRPNLPNGPSSINTIPVTEINVEPVATNSENNTNI